MINVFLAFFVVMANSSRSILKHKHLLWNIFSSDLSSFSQMAAPGHGGLAAKKLLVTRMESEIPEPAVEMLKNQLRHFFLFIYDNFTALLRIYLFLRRVQLYRLKSYCVNGQCEQLSTSWVLELVHRAQLIERTQKCPFNELGLSRVTS